jgi:hypothetical protein
MEQGFKIRSYGYAELAQLYFPNVTKKSASVQLRRWIVANRKLQTALEEVGFVPGQKLITPKQVSLMTEFFGEPYD